MIHGPSYVKFPSSVFNDASFFMAFTLLRFIISHAYNFRCAAAVFFCTGLPFPRCPINEIIFCIIPNITLLNVCEIEE